MMVVATAQAVITKIGHPSREGVADTIKDCLKRNWEFKSHMRDYPDAICDGGDVLDGIRLLALSARNTT
jgi:N-dimethylarginine dimethylaminohydrolase